MPDPKPKGLHAKLALILGDLEGLEPSGRNKHFSYDYWEANQVSAMFRTRLNKMGISFMADVVDIRIDAGKTAKGGHTWLTTLRVLFTLTDSESGETISGHGVGQGDDPSDKGSNKAFSGALKYWLLKVFLVGGEDAEADDRADRRYEEDNRSVGYSGGYDGDEYDARSSRRDDRRVEIQDVDPPITGIERGGRSTQATEIQVTRVRDLAGKLEMGLSGLGGIIEQVLDRKVDLDGPEEPRAEMRRFLESLSADDIGNVIRYLESMVDLSEGR